MSKRKAHEEEDEYDGAEEIAAAKKSRGEQSTALISAIKSQHSSLILRDNNLNQRLSSLSAPELSLSGHEGAVYGVAFDPTGKFLCSGSLDRQICKFLFYLFYSLIIVNIISNFLQYFGMFLVDARITTCFTVIKMQFFKLFGRPRIISFLAQLIKP